ncbi:MAG: radical SAM protein [Desulfarculaceae bacterium]|jgi:radical SAM protein with 4Fe4S-binding SPASM domain
MAAEIEHTQDQYNIRQGARDFPLMAVLSFVYVCNAKCPNCPYTNSEIRHDYSDTPLMSEKTFKLIADQCGQHGAWLRISGGGEPMLHPQAVELFEYAKAKGCKIGLITNGSRFSGDDMERLLACGIDMIEFSVDAGDPQTYKRVRPGLDWDRLVQNVKSLGRLRDQTGAVTKIIASVINQEGVDVEQAVEFWEPLVDEVQKRKYLTWGINENHSADPTPYLPPEDRVPCPFLFERLNIDSRGKVMVCGFDIRAVTNMGNVHDQSIAEIWQGKGFEHFRQKHLDRKGDEIPLCRDCPDWKYRSWKHNYWKIVDTAEKRRQAKAGGELIEDS